MDHPTVAVDRAGRAEQSKPRSAQRRTMKAAIFVEPGRIVLDDKPLPDVGPLDALVRITTTGAIGEGQVAGGIHLLTRAAGVAWLGLGAYGLYEVGVMLVLSDLRVPRKSGCAMTVIPY